MGGIAFDEGKVSFIIQPLINDRYTVVYMHGFFLSQRTEAAPTGNMRFSPEI